MEAKLKQIVEKLQSAAGDNLQAAVLYGSAVTGEFQAHHSDLNIVCLVKRATAADLEAMHGVAEWWMREGPPAPLVFTYEELQRSADVFSIELYDIKARHRMLYGEDFFSQLEVPLHLHRLLLPFPACAGGAGTTDARYEAAGGGRDGVADGRESERVSRGAGSAGREAQGEGN